MTLPISYEQKRLLGLGRVPSLRRRLLPRPLLSDQLFHRLKEFLTNPGSEWFLVHGMVGSGKSELLVKILWERPELCFALVDRILWVTDRHFHSAELEHLAADTLLLAASLDHSTYISQMDECQAGKNPELSSVAKSLRILLNDQFAKTLLIVDGVQMVETVNFFDQIKGPMCKILATSSSRALFEGLENVQTFGVPSDGCTAEMLEQMALNYSITEKFSAERVNAILCGTGGNLVILEKMFVMARGCSAIFDSLLAQLRYSPLSLVSCHSAYYNCNLEKSLQRCFEMLGDTLSCSFDHCVVIETFHWTNFEIFPLFWPFDVCGSESEDELRAIVFRQLETLEANSLLDKSTNDIISEGYPADRFSSFRFRLHPMVHNFLQFSRPNSYVSFDVAFRMLTNKLGHQSQISDDRTRIYRDYLAENEQRLFEVQKNIGQWKNANNHFLKNERNRSDGYAFEGENSTDGGRRRGLIISTTETIGRWIRRAMGKVKGESDQ